MKLEVKNGFKKTDVGIVPNDWSVYNLNEIVEVCSGGTPSTSVSEYWNGDVNWYTPTEIGDKKYVSESVRKITKLGLEKSSARLLPIDTVLMTTRATIGDLAILKEPGATNQGFQSLISRGLNSEFLYYLMGSLKRTLISLASGSTFLEISPNKIRGLNVALPPKEEQHAIANALSDVDALITSLDTLIAKKKAIKKGAMQQLLTGKSRLDGFGKNTKYKQSEVGIIPEDWEVIELGSIGRAIIGLTYSPSDVKSTGVLVHRSSNIQDNKLSYHDNVYVDVDISDNLRLLQGDILICVRNGSRNLIGKSAYIDGKSVGETWGAFMSVFRTDTTQKLIYQYIISNVIQTQINASLGATINQITNKTLNEFKIPLSPTKEEQEAIATILSDMDKEIEALEAKKEKYIQIKQGMAQELLTGKTRLV